MRAPSLSERLRLLDAAFDVGMTHFDVAPSYGLGAAESVLGKFLRSHAGERSRLTVASKFGLRTVMPSRIAKLIDRPARALMRQFPGLRRSARRSVSDIAVAPTPYSIAEAEASVVRSLRDMKIDHLDILLLHDVRPEQLEDTFIEWLSGVRARGLVGSIGIATSPHDSRSVLELHPGVFSVVQVESNLIQPASRFLGNVPIPLRVSHGVFRDLLSRLEQHARTDKRWSESFSEVIARDVHEPGALARVLLAWALRENPQGIVLVGASRAGHFAHACEALAMADEDLLDRLGNLLVAALSDQPHRARIVFLA